MVSPGASDDTAGQTSADAKVDVGLAPKLTASSPTGPGSTLSSNSGLSREVTRSATKPTPEGMADAGADLVDSAPIGQNEADAFDTVPHPNEPKGGEYSALFEGPDIADARMELEECPPEDPDRVNVLNRLARALFLNFQETGQEGFLLECIDIGRYICRTGPHACLDSSMDEADTYTNLAMALETRYEQTGDVAAFNEALAVNRGALALRFPGHAKRSIPCASLNRIIFTRMSRAPEDVPVEEILAFCTELSLLLPSGPCDAEATTCSDVATYLQHCYDRTEDPQHLDEAIKFAKEARLLTSPGHAACATMCSNLSVLLWSRFRLTRDESCADEAVALDREALELTPVGHPDRAHRCEGVIHSLSERRKFSGNGSPLDDEESVALGREALALRPQGHPARVRTCIYLSNAVFQCFEAARDTKIPLLKEAITLQREVLALTPRGHSFRAMACINLARSLVAHRADTQLIDEAIALGREAVELRPPGHPLRANACASLSVSLMAQFTVTNDTPTLVECVELTREAATSSSRMYPGRGSALYHLADGLQMLFDSTGDKAVLDEAMARSKESLDVRQKGHAATFAQLAALAGTRATYTGYRSLLDDAIAYKKQQISMEHDLERERLCATQATLFSMMFRRTGNVTFLDRAIVLEREALSLSPHGHPLRHVNCGCLSASLQVHYIETGSKASLLEAITLLKEQRLLMSDDNPHLPHVLTALAKALIMLFDEVGGVSLAEEALTLYHTALESLPQDSPIRWIVLTALTRAHADHRSPSFDMATAVKYLHKALSSTAHLPAELLGEVSRCLDRIDIAVVPASSHALLLRCFSAVIDLSSLIAGYAPDRTSQLIHLYVFADLGRRAWEFASLVGQHETGLELLERARGVMWWQSLQVRNPDLTSAPPKFAAELVESPQTNVQHIITRIRRERGYEDFMRGPSFHALRGTAALHPVVILVPVEEGCDALIMQPDQAGLSHLPLRGVRLDRLAHLTSSSFPTRESRLTMSVSGPKCHLHRTLAALWTDVVKPVFQFLGLRTCAGSARPRLHWCPTGDLSSLPLHAAGLYDGSRVECCSDYVVSSYTPTVAALLHVQAGDSALNRDHAKLALVATEIAYAQHLPRLPSVVTEMEVIRTMAEQANIAVDVGCAHGSASVARVVEVLESTDIAHIACHGSQDDDEALSSGLFLGDGSLTIRHLMELDLEHAFLAFLSACETAKGDSEQPEETVHLAAAMMFSGFKSVVATMWAMNDADGPRVARLFYERLFAEKVITTDIVPYCLDHAVTELRRSGASPERWATFIHMGA